MVGDRHVRTVARTGAVDAMMARDAAAATSTRWRWWHALWSLPVLAFIAVQMRPVLGRLDRAVLGSLDGTDAVFQSGILTWTARHFWQPAVCIDLPIFYPARSALVAMDTLVGQAVMVAPLTWVADPTPALLYNLAVAVTLLLVALAGALLWLAFTDDEPPGRRAAGAALCALFLLGSPFTTWQLSMLNQISPPWVVLLVAALWRGWRRFSAGGSPRPWWWTASACLVVQAAWGWYGFADAVFVLGTALAMGLWCARRDQRAWPLARSAALPALAAAVLVLGLAWPYLQLRSETPEYTRELQAVQHYGAHLHVLGNLGPHRLGWADLAGTAPAAAERAMTNVDAVMHPGWLALIGAALAVATWRRWPAGLRRGRWFLVALGAVGFVMAFGDSVGVPPGSDRRIILPFGILREVLTPFEAFRAPSRFLFLTVIATSWLATVGVTNLARERRWIVAVLGVLVWLESIPVAVLAVPIEVDGRRSGPLVASHPDGAVLTLPAPRTEADEGVAETLWLHRALATGHPVTGGVSGWVPPRTRALRERLAACERGEVAVADLLAEMRALGVVAAEIRLQDSDPGRVVLWQQELRGLGHEGRRSVPGYQVHVLVPSAGS
ncbi:hypothetical protein GF314_10190 [bacterium]|nr:hypothetical protein [bacterium]